MSKALLGGPIKQRYSVRFGNEEAWSSANAVKVDPEKDGSEIE